MLGDGIQPSERETSESGGGEKGMGEEIGGERNLMGWWKQPRQLTNNKERHEIIEEYRNDRAIWTLAAASARCGRRSRSHLVSLTNQINTQKRRIAKFVFFFLPSNKPNFPVILLLFFTHFFRSDKLDFNFGRTQFWSCWPELRSQSQRTWNDTESFIYIINMNNY